jgi:hypothetical protein
MVLSTELAFASAQSTQPHQWPASDVLAPQLEAWPNAIRFHGANRYQTNLATSLALRGSGTFPYGTPDSTVASAGASSDNAGWWGANRCPRAVILVAGDSPADALSAASLSDATGSSREPFMQRSAAADPLFDPVGGFARVDTDFAPIIITDSARRGATTLTISARYSLQDFRSGGCRTAREAIIVGGPAAVPYEVEAEILSLGYDSVYRVSGMDRFATAGSVANALGTEPVPANVSECDDAVTRDGSSHMHFYANSVIEWRISDRYCEVLGKSVVLADGVTGADALAAGWWTSYWQVPILLHDGSNKLPAATVKIMQTLDISNLIVLGGENRIPDAVLAEAQQLTKANIRRVAGQDRYSTSVLMAQRFGGWWPASGGSRSRGSMLCFVASSGIGTRSVGWSDALGAGAWCSAASWASSNNGAPERAIGPVNGQLLAKTEAVLKPSNDSMPVILVPYGATELPSPVAEFIKSVYSPVHQWCSNTVLTLSCSNPGFAVVFGGSKAVKPDLVDTLSVLLGGGVDGVGTRTEPFLDGGFVTKISMAPIYHETSSGETRLCANRNGFSDARWLVVGLEQNPVVQSALDTTNPSTDWYRHDPDGVSRSAGISSPGCVRISAGESREVWMSPKGIDGRSGVERRFALDGASKFVIIGNIETSALDPISSSGLSTSVSNVAGETRISFGTQKVDAEAVMRGETADIIESSINLLLERSDASSELNATFVGSWQISVVHGSVVGQVKGEARMIDGQWILRGESSVSGGTWNQQTGNGGFAAEISVNSEDSDDDTMFWQLDAAVGTR